LETVGEITLRQVKANDSNSAVQSVLLLNQQEVNTLFLMVDGSWVGGFGGPTKNVNEWRKTR
jgi:hypothetical protein